jgi:hypothetical protein
MRPAQAEISLGTLVTSTFPLYLGIDILIFVHNNLFVIINSAVFYLYHSASIIH